MGVPSPRTPVRVARGTYSVLNTNKASLEEGEVCYATDENRLYIKEGGSIEATTAAADATKASLSGATFTGDVVIDNAKELRLSEADGSGANYTGIKAQAQSGDITLTLPAVAPTANQVLKADASTPTTLTWAADSATDSTKLPLAGGTLSGNVVLNDDVEFQFGALAGGDLKIYHNGTSHDSWIEERGTGELNLASNQIMFKNAAKDETLASFVQDVGCTLYFNNSATLGLDAQGVNITGGIDLTGSIIFEGATDDAHETTLAVTDPTADRTITLPNATGTAALLQEDQAWSGSQRGTISDVGTKTANFDFDLNTANNFKITVGADSKEFGFTNITAGQAGTIEVVNGAYALTWGSEVHFVGGTVPTITQSATSFLAYYCPSNSVVFVQHMLNVKQGGT